MTERIVPTGEELKHTGLSLLKTLGRIVTLQGFLPEQPLASHGDHVFDEPLEVTKPWQIETTPVAIRGFDSEGSYREEIV